MIFLSSHDNFHLEGSLPLFKDHALYITFVLNKD